MWCFLYWQPSSIHIQTCIPQQCQSRARTGLTMHYTRLVNGLPWNAWNVPDCAHVRDESSLGILNTPQLRANGFIMQLEAFWKHLYRWVIICLIGGCGYVLIVQSANRHFVKFNCKHTQEPLLHYIKLHRRLLLLARNLLSEFSCVQVSLHANSNSYSLQSQREEQARKVNGDVRSWCKWT